LFHEHSRGDPSLSFPRKITRKESSESIERNGEMIKLFASLVHSGAVSEHSEIIGALRSLNR